MATSSYNPVFKKKGAETPVLRALTALIFIANAVSVHAQERTLPAVTVSADAPPPAANVSGFGDMPLSAVPISATVIDSGQIAASGARRLSDLTQFDASVTDSYNSPGYWDFLTVRGFVLDNRFNYQREGLPISAETSIPLDNKERVEILRGTSGIQAGTSAPGGLVNYVVKRPTEKDLREVRTEYSSRGSLLGAVDLGGRFGADRQFGYRFNAAFENLKPQTHNIDGNRNLFSLAADWRVTRDSLVEFEIEKSHKTQPSQAGFSLLGNVLPAVPNPNLNLNNQPWSQPSRFDALTGTLRFTQALARDWRWSAQVGRQRLKTDDRLAFPFGCGAEGNFDRYCSDGTFDFYDFRSENERRVETAGNLSLKGSAMTGSVRHELAFGLTRSQVRNRFDDSAFNYVGSGNIVGTAIVPPDPGLTTPNTNRNERSTEFSVHDAIHWNEQLTTWVGVRYTRLSRTSIGTDGANPTAYSQTFTTPWVAASYALRPDLLAYASWGKGVESQLVPNLPIYSNAGQALPALESRQWEIGLKGTQAAFDWRVAYFDIRRPATNLDTCDAAAGACTIGFDGAARHRGVEASGQWRRGPWRLASGLTWLDARRESSIADPAVNGERPTNVPRAVVRAQAAYRLASVPGLEIEGQLSHEGKRNVLADGSIELPSWTRFDTALRYDTKWQGTSLRWTLAVENVLNRRYWKESPTQFSHVYLFPGSARTLRLGLSAAL